jgi:hypothetical protein
VDLRNVPRAQWDEHLYCDVILPPMAIGFLLERDSSRPFTEKEVHTIENETEWFHNISPPYYVHMDIGLQQTGRPWHHVEEAGHFLSGLTLGKE